LISEIVWSDGRVDRADQLASCKLGAFTFGKEPMMIIFVGGKPKTSKQAAKKAVKKKPKPAKKPSKAK
jgi:hypothetical protein